jgi:hypothetical protein
MTEPDDEWRLPEWAYTETEMHDMAVANLEIEKYSEDPTNIVFYHLFKEGVNTGLVLIAAVKSVIDGQEAIDRLWAEVGITAIVGECNEELHMNQTRVDAMHLLLQKYKYAGKLKLPGADKVFVYQKWMAKMM